MTFDLIVQNGTVIDGTGNDRFKADIGINHVIVGGESIVEAGNCTTALPGKILTNHGWRQ